MTKQPAYAIHAYGNDDDLPAALEELFADELAYSREPLPVDREDRGKWRFVCACAVTPEGRVLGGIHVDMGPKNFGPLADELYAMIERWHVEVGCDKQAMEEALFAEAIRAARDAGCTHIQAQVSWNEADDVRALRACGFALTDLTGPGEGDLYFAMKPLDG